MLCCLLIFQMNAMYRNEIIFAANNVQVYCLEGKSRQEVRLSGQDGALGL